MYTTKSKEDEDRKETINIYEGEKNERTNRLHSPTTIRSLKNAAADDWTVIRMKNHKFLTHTQIMQ